MTNAEWLVNHGRKFSDVEFKAINNAEKPQAAVYSSGILMDIVPLEIGFSEWLDRKYVPLTPVLDDVEREYLCGFLHPWCKLDILISKETRKRSGKEYLCIRIYFSNGDHTVITLPSFKSGTMYRGMAVGRLYSARELKIFEGTYVF